MKWFYYFFGIFAAISFAYFAATYVYRLGAIIVGASWMIIVPVAVVIFCAVLATIVYTSNP